MLRTQGLGDFFFDGNMGGIHRQRMCLYAPSASLKTLVTFSKQSSLLCGFIYKITDQA